MYLRDLEQIDKNPPKCSQTRDPDLRDQIPKRMGSKRFALQGIEYAFLQLCSYFNVY
jgi:hypothetical protein